jgi:predicted pyridoxine 5'-phosphate oxidase superfamily flavin-nucleotide-binding protein
MINEEIKQFVERISLATVATSDDSGNPHLAMGNDIKVLDPEHLAFENWFCHATLRNLEMNPQVAVAVMAPDSAIGYQFVGVVAHGFDAAIMNGYAPLVEPSGEPQTLTRLVVRVNKILVFCSGIHTDQPLVE